MKTAVVTGASGFVGSALTHNLTNNGYNVLALGRKSIGNLSDYRRELISGSIYKAIDLGNPERLGAILDAFLGHTHAKLDYFFHLAWYGRHRLSDLDIHAQFLNIPTTIKLYDLAANYGASRFIYCGSMEEAFAEAYTHLDHTIDCKSNRHVVYAMAKLAARSALKLAWKGDQPDLVMLTNSHVIGIEDDKDSFLQVATSKLMRGEVLDMSTGEQTFDVVNVRDCASAYRLAAELGRRNTSYWVGSGEPRSLREYVEIITRMFPSGKVNYGAMPFNDVILPRSLFSIESLTNDTGYMPQVTFKASIEELACSLASS